MKRTMISLQEASLAVMSDSDNTEEPHRKALVVFVRYPQPGKVKSRLEEGIGSATITADLYRCFVMDVLDAARSVYDNIIISYEPSVREGTYQEWLGDSFEYMQQRGDDIGRATSLAFSWAVTFLICRKKLYQMVCVCLILWMR